MAAKYELKCSAKGKFMFNLKAGNGEVILTSESYDTKKNAENGIASVKANAPNAASFEMKKAKDGQTYFVLLAKNKQVIGKSEMYKSEAGAKRGVASVQKNAGVAVSDITEAAPKATAKKPAAKKAAAKKAAGAAS